MDIARLALDVDTRKLKAGERDLKGFSKQSETTAKQVDRDSALIADAFRRVGGALAAGFTVTEYVRLADTFSSMNAQLRLVTGSAAELADVERRLFEISQANRVGFESTVELYARIARSTDALGVSQEQVLRVTDTINKALVISGTSAQQASGALLQLGQAFASGTLRGDELNSILEGMPRVARAIAEGMGVTVGQLRALGAQGKLTSEEVFNALLKMSQGIDEEFGRMPVTVGQAFTVLGNSVLNLVGEFDQASNSSASLAESLVGLSQILDGSSGFVRSFGQEIDKAFQGLSFLAGKVQSVADTFLSYYIPAVEKAREAMRWLGIPVFGGAGGGGGNSTLDVVNSLKRAARETAPPVERLGMTAIQTGAALSRNLGGGSSEASRSLRSIGREADDAARKMQALQDRLFPFEAAMRQLEADENLIRSNKQLTEARKEELLAALEQERFRSRTGRLGDATVSRGLVNTGPLNAGNDNDLGKTVERMRAEAEAARLVAEGDWKGAMKVLEQSSMRTTVTVAENFAQMSQNVVNSIQGLANSIRGGDFLGILGGVLNIFTSLGSAGVFGGGVQNFLSRSSFDGGGYTGSGSRSGGLDGKGGFLAMLHPNETVIDHHRGQRMPANDTNVRVTVGIDPNSGNVTAFVNNQIAATAPAIANAGAALAQGQMAQRARRRVR